MSARLLSPRVYASIAVVIGLLGLVASSWWVRGIDDATRLFQLIHGVLLATMTFLWGAEALDRAEARADRAASIASGAQAGAREATEVEMALERELQVARSVLAELWNDPATREKVEEAARRLGGR